MDGPPARALALASAGAAALLVSRGFGTPALATLGIGLLALPIMVTAIVWVAAGGMRIERRIAPLRCRAGDEVRVEAQRSGWVARAGLDRLLDVEIDPGLGDALGSAAATREGDIWRVAAVRGDHRLPPARMTVRDPFGLAHRARDAGGDSDLLVVPVAPAIERVPMGARGPGRGPRRRRADSGLGELDRVREYQMGDPLSRVHWAQTAKRGRLQTKEMRTPEDSGRSVVVLLDGAAPAGADFETAVTAAAAMLRRLSAAGRPAGLCQTGPAPARITPRAATWPVLESALARVGAGGDRSLALALSAEAGGPDAPDTVIVVTSAGDPGLAAAVGRARAHGVGVAAVLTGSAAVAAADLVAAGAEVVVVAGPGRVAEALAAPSALPRAAAR